MQLFEHLFINFLIPPTGLLVLLMMLASLTGNAQEYPRGDVSQDGKVSIEDVTVLIDYLLNGTWPNEEEYVDLGLPSGTLWATMNIGATSPEEYGNYFAWGETSPKNAYLWETYEWCYGTYNTLTKYCTISDWGTVDNITELEPEDDAAYVNWGPSWRMPTKTQQDELREQCTWTATTRNNVNGQLVTGPNGNSIFLPCPGYRLDALIYGKGEYGYYWSRTLFDGSAPYQAYFLGIQSGDVDSYYNDREEGYTVRAVRVSSN